MKIRNEAYGKAFGENLKKLRTARKLSREKLAAEAGIESKQIYNIEVGDRSPTVYTLVAIANALGVHPRKLLDFEFDFEK